MKESFPVFSVKIHELAKGMPSFLNFAAHPGLRQSCIIVL